ncbi:MAG: hypothetical protein WBH03_12795 [Cyclobacteriaceae bacterium]
MKKYNLFILLLGFIGFTACGDDDAPDAENPEEIITDVTLTFTPMGGGAAAVFTANDPDGDGPQDIAVSGPVMLDANMTYTLDIALEGVGGENITEEVEEEGEEHQFFFSFTDGLFSSPAGDGNIDNRSDALDYQDQDDSGQPIGLMTDWTTSASPVTGSFRVLLKHQPDIKTATSGSTDGETDVDLTWSIEIQ